jgi:porphyrinogen peroxidase
MSMPQMGIFAQGTGAHYFLEYTLRPAIDREVAADALQQLRQPAVSAGGVNLVIAFGAHLWHEIAPNHTPPSLRPFTEVIGTGDRRAPATQRDVWLWINASTADVVFEHARAADNALQKAFVRATDQPCFVHRDSRDLTGFIDGTANPQSLEAPDVALLPDGQVGEGGGFVVAMRWVHDLDAFDRLSVKEQEEVFGRTKLDSVELDGDLKPATAHIARVEIHDAAGEELPIFRRSVPFGTVTEHGLYFVAFSNDLDRFDTMLARMFGASDDGVHDRLTEFSCPVSGAYYFAPSLTRLNDLAAG